MALVEHEIPPGSGKRYLYEHFRGGDGKVHCKYLGVAGNVKTVDSIPQSGFPVTHKKYEEGHKAGIREEEKEYGKDRVKELDKHIEKVIPNNELAGSHTEKRPLKILVNKKTDKKYHGQIITHENREHEVMTGEKIIKDEPKGSKEICRRIETNPKKDEILGYKETREPLTPSQQKKTAVVMREYESGKLYSGSGEKVTDRKQALAIAHSEARKI